MSSLLGTYFKHLRTEQGLTLRQIAEAINVDPSLSRLERGDVANPADDVLMKLAETLGRPAGELYLVAGRITPGMQAKLLQAPAFVVQKTALVLGQLEAGMRQGFEEYDEAPVVQQLPPEQQDVMNQMFAVLAQVEEIANAVSRGRISPVQLDHVENILKSLKLALLAQPKVETP